MTSVLVLSFKLLIGDECLFRRELLFWPMRNLLIFLSRELSTLECFKLVSIFFPRDCLIFAPRIQFTLQQLSMRKLVRVIRQLVIPLRLRFSRFAWIWLRQLLWLFGLHRGQRASL